MTVETIVLIQFVALFQIFTADEHDAVAVDNASILIYSDLAIGVAIKCQADIRFFSTTNLPRTSG